MQYQKFSVDSVVPNDWNMNKVEALTFEKLKQDIQKIGDNSDQPILVRKHPLEEGKYQIIDGEHRWRACKDLGYPEVYVKIVELDDKDSILKTISMNKFRGDFDTIKLAETFHMLKEKFEVTDSYIQEVLGYTETELQGFEDLLNFDFDKYQQDEDSFIEEFSKDQEDMGGKSHSLETISFECTEEQKMVIEEAILVCKNEIQEELDIEALCLICKDFLSKKV